MTKIVYIAHIIPVTVKEYPQSRRIIVSLDRINRRIGDIECFYIKVYRRILVTVPSA